MPRAWDENRLITNSSCKWDTGDKICLKQQCRRLETKVSFMICGAQKAGTTALATNMTTAGNAATELAKLINNNTSVHGAVASSFNELTSSFLI